MVTVKTKRCLCLCQQSHVKSAIGLVEVFGTSVLWTTVAFKDIFLCCNSLTGTGISSSVLLQNAWSRSSSAVQETFLKQLGLPGNPAHWLAFTMAESYQLDAKCDINPLKTYFHCQSQYRHDVSLLIRSVPFPFTHQHTNLRPYLSNFWE